MFATPERHVVVDGGEHICLKGGGIGMALKMYENSATLSFKGACRRRKFPYIWLLFSCLS